MVPENLKTNSENKRKFLLGICALLIITIQQGISSTEEVVPVRIVHPYGPSIPQDDMALEEIIINSNQLTAENNTHNVQPHPSLLKCIGIKIFEGGSYVLREAFPAVLPFIFGIAFQKIVEN